jgi:hypothetical protein
MSREPLLYIRKQKDRQQPTSRNVSSDVSLWSLSCLGFPWSLENKNCCTRINCCVAPFLACCDRHVAFY